MFESIKGTTSTFDSVEDIRIAFAVKEETPSRVYQVVKWATPYSEFKQVREICTAQNHDGVSLVATTSVTYYIDNYEVSEQSFCNIINKLEIYISKITNKTAIATITHSTDGVTIWTYKDNVNPIKGTRADHVVFDESWHESWHIAKSEEKGDKIMKNLTITNYKYDPETRTTTLFWSDKTQTSVTADPDTEANEFTGFCATCAKKLFGNKSTWLNQFDKWTVKKPEQEKKKAELEKAKAEEQAKINAEKAERAKARKIKRLAKRWVNDYKTANERLEIYEAAEKMAKEKYGVPNEYFGR